MHWHWNFSSHPRSRERIHNHLLEIFVGEAIMAGTFVSAIIFAFTCRQMPTYIWENNFPGYDYIDCSTVHYSCEYFWHKQRIPFSATGVPIMKGQIQQVNQQQSKCRDIVRDYSR